MANIMRRDALKGAAALASLLISSCSDRDDNTSSAARSFKKDDLTPLERKYGLGPGKSNSSGKNYMKVRPDAHLVEQGPAAIRAVAANGLSWTLDPKITGPIDTGRVLFVTNRCAGRVLATRPAGDQVEVVLGPAELTDYIEECDISTSEPIDLSQAILYEAPDYPGAVAKLGGEPSPPTAWNGFEPRASHAIYRGDEGSGDFQRVTDVDTPDVKQDPRFKVTPVFDVTSLGVQITSLNDVINMLGDARLRFSAPRLEFDLVIPKGSKKVLKAIVRITGAAALLVTFKAHSNYGVNGNIRTRHFVPIDCAFPIAALSGLPLPFAATMRHTFLLETAFSSKGNVDATGQYGLTGSLEMSFGTDGIHVAAPSGFEVQRSLVKSVSGVTMGPAGLILAHQVRAIVGIGYMGFVTGPFVGMTSTAAVTKASSAGMTSEQCREATLRMSIHGGIGYQIPEGVANAINTVLSIFHIGRIPPAGGIRTSDQPLVSKTEHYPSLAACRAAGVSS
jgi:hypothetical protein